MSKTPTSELLQRLAAYSVSVQVGGERLELRPPWPSWEEVPTAARPLLGELKRRQAEVRSFLATKPAMAVTVEERTERRCYACKGSRWWESQYGNTVCAVCHPPPALHLVRRWHGCEAEQART
jgi:hypothetical protein